MFRWALRKLTHVALTLLVFLYIVFEELIWETIARPIYRFIHALGIVHKVELVIVNLSPKIILVIFLLLFLFVEALGVVAVGLLAKGNLLGGVLLYLGKIPIGIVTFWLFNISKEKLLAFGWFNAVYSRLMKLIDSIKSSAIYHEVKAKSAFIKEKIKTYAAHFKATYFQDKGSFKRRFATIYLGLKRLFRLKER